VLKRTFVSNLLRLAVLVHLLLLMSVLLPVDKVDSVGTFSAKS